MTSVIPDVSTAIPPLLPPGGQENVVAPPACAVELDHVEARSLGKQLLAAAELVDASRAVDRSIVLFLDGPAPALLVNAGLAPPRAPGMPPMPRGEV